MPLKIECFFGIFTHNYLLHNVLSTLCTKFSTFILQRHNIALLPRRGLILITPCVTRGDKTPYLPTPKVLNKEYLPEKCLFNTFGVVYYRVALSPNFIRGYPN